MCEPHGVSLEEVTGIKVMKRTFCLDWSALNASTTVTRREIPLKERIRKLLGREREGSLWLEGKLYNSTFSC